MKTIVKQVISLILSIAILLQGCSIPSALRAVVITSTPVPPTVKPSSTPYPTIPARTPTPLHTPSPIPPPLLRIPAGDRAIFLGDYERALKEYQNAVNNAADSETQAAGLVGMGQAQLLSGKVQPAIQALITVIERFPQSNQRANAHFFLAQCYLSQQLPSKAAESYANYLNLRPGTLDTYIQERRGDALTAAGDLPGALKAYTEATSAPQLNKKFDIEIKIGKTHAAMGDHSSAIRKLMAIYQATNNEYTKATVNLLAGQSYLALGLPDQAYARYNDSVLNFPRSYDSYTALVALVNANIPVNEFSRGLINYYVGQHGLAIDAFNRYLKANEKHEGDVHHFKSLSMRAINQYEGAINEWQMLIKDHPNDKYWGTAYEEIAQTQWQYLNKPELAVQTLLTYLKTGLDSNTAPQIIFRIGRIQEASNRLAEAASSWERLIIEYPTADISSRALFLAGIVYFRAGNYQYALTTFQRHLVLSSTPEDQAAAYLWIGKSYQALKDQISATAAWEQAALRDPTGYYSERARELILNRSPLSAIRNFDLGFDLARERIDAEKWMRTTFSLPVTTDLSSLGPLGNDARLRRGSNYWELGLFEEARDELDSLRQDQTNDPVNNYRLINYFLDLGLYREAILVSRQILTLANMDNVATLNAPIFFNHIRFGPYYYETVLTAAQSNNINPLLLFSIIRQESMFEGFVRSSAGARGLMQIMPATGKEIAAQFRWPPNYSDDDLYRPIVSVQLGARYFARQRDFFNGDLYAALAAYNGGPGNTKIWKDISSNDPDLFLEVIRFPETRQYIMQIVEFNSLYHRIYERNP